MKTITKLPDLAKSAKLLKFSVELENVSPHTLLGMSILSSLKKGKIKETINMIKSMAQDNYRIMSEVVGEPLLKEIMQFEGRETVDDLPETLFQSPSIKTE